MIYLFYLLAVLWSLGCFIIPLIMGISMFADREPALGATLILLGWPAGCLFAYVPWALISEAQSPDLATLKKSEWVCAQSHPVTTTTYIMTGKVLVPVTNTHQECDQYNRSNRYE